MDGDPVYQDSDLLAFTPRRLTWLPELDCLVQIIQEQTQLFALKVGKTQTETLLRLFPAINNNSMASAYVQTFYQNAFSSWPSDGFWLSILTDNLLGLHESSGVPAVSGQSFEMGATQTEPLSDWESEIEQTESDSANMAAARLNAFI